MGYVAVRGGGKGGKIVLEYFDDEELDRLISLLLPGNLMTRLHSMPDYP